MSYSQTEVILRAYTIFIGWTFQMVILSLLTWFLSSFWTLPRLYFFRKEGSWVICLLTFDNRYMGSCLPIAWLNQLVWIAWYIIKSRDFVPHFIFNIYLHQTWQVSTTSWLWGPLIVWNRKQRCLSLPVSHPYDCTSYIWTPYSNR